MIRRSSSPGLGQWLTVTIGVVLSLFLAYKFYAYSLLTEYYPAGLTVGGVDVSNMTREEAEQVLTDRYINAGIILNHPNGTFELNPLDAEMRIDLETMLSAADYQRVQQDFWSGFWGFLWDRPVDVAMVPLTATHNANALLRVLNAYAQQYDEPAEPPQPVPASLTFQFGNPGKETNMPATLQNVENALYRSIGRQANFVVEPVEPDRPDILLLSRLIVNHVQGFEGNVSVFIMDLETRDEIAYQADIAMSGMDMLKVPIVLQAFRMLDDTPTISQTALISDTLLGTTGDSPNQLLNMIAGKNDDYLGADLTTQSLEQLGLQNTYILASYDAPLRRGNVALETPANSRADLVTAATPGMQTTAEDMGTLLAMLYYCAEANTEALRLLYRDELTQAECQMMLDTMSANRIGSLIEGGVPADIRVAHRHGWINDTHGDAGIVYTPNGDYVIVMMAYKPDWLEWELSSPLLADIAQATYNYFNFENPFVNGARAN